jgi:uncharacterized protein (TIGR03067 family)
MRSAFGWAAVGLVVLTTTSVFCAEVSKKAEQKRIARLIRHLGHDWYAKRKPASKELLAIGWPALAALRKAAASSEDAEIRRRARRLRQAIVSAAVAKEEKKFGGTLEGFYLKCRGPGGASEYDLDTLEVDFHAGMIEVKNPFDRKVIRFRWELVDPTSNPKKMDFIEPKGGRIRAIYKMEDETIHWCASQRGEARPNNFTTEKVGQIYLKLRRVSK